MDAHGWSYVSWIPRGPDEPVGAALSASAPKGRDRYDGYRHVASNLNQALVVWRGAMAPIANKGPAEPQSASDTPIVPDSIGADQP